MPSSSSGDDGRDAAPTAVVHVDLPLDDPAIDVGVNALVERGFFYCGLLPEFGPGDVLRMQRLLDGGSASGQSASSQQPRLANDGARRLLEVIDLDAGGR